MDVLVLRVLNYTPIYAEGYIVFVFPFVRSYLCMYVCMYICLFVRFAVTLTKLRQNFALKFLKCVYLNNIREHSYLGHRYLEGSAYIP